MKNLSLGKRLFFSIIMLFLGFAIVFVVFQHSREKSYKISLVNNKLQDYNFLVYENISWDSILDTSNNPKMETAISNYMALHKIKSLRLTLITNEGRVIFDSKRKDYNNILNHLNRQEITEALQKGSGYDISRQSSTVDEDFFYSATYFKDKNLIIRSALPYNSYLTGQMKTNNFYLYLSAFIMLILVVILYRFSSHLGKNITKLNIFAKKASLNESLETSELLDFPKDELGQIAEKIITLYKKLQQTKQEQNILKHELTQNIAHELKTPVASIQGYLETILTSDVDEKTKQMFIERSYKQSQRLTSLLQDISTLNRLDDATNKEDFSEVNINNIISQIQQETSLQLQEKDMKININITKNIIVNGNYSLLYSVFRNLVDNSIHYAGNNTTINIQAKQTDDNNYAFVFEDNGVGVESKHLDRLFERFYRIDKGRSRKMGGTGLGLAIVKNAIAVHGGQIKVKQNRPQGLKFEFTLPIA